MNSRRLHCGYHYPRSPETVRELRSATETFRERYGSAVIDRLPHYVAIPRHGSLVSADEYLRFCESFDLKYNEEFPSFFRRESIELVLRVPEAAIDIEALRCLCWQHLTECGVQVNLRAPADYRSLGKYEWIVLATYAALNSHHYGLGDARQLLRFDIVEIPVVEIPRQLKRASVLVMDGPFISVDPLNESNRSLLWDVRHGIHAMTVGLSPLIPRELYAEIDSSFIRHPKVTKFPRFMGTAHKYLVGMENARHMGSFFTVRTLLPGMERTDGRPTVIRRIGERTIALLGGKIATSVNAGIKVADLVESG